MTNNHPEESKISAFLHGELSRLESMKIEQHIDHCEKCQELTEELISAQSDILPQLDAVSLCLKEEQKELLSKTLINAIIVTPKKQDKVHIFYKIAALFIVLFVVTYAISTNKHNDFDKQKQNVVDQQNFDIITNIDNSSEDRRYIISIASHKPSPINHQPQSVTVILDTSGIAIRKNEFKLLENHLAGIMNRVTEKDKLTVIINGAGRGLQEVQLAGLVGKEAVETVLEVRLSARPELIDSLDYGYQYAAKTYSNEAENSVILLSSTQKANSGIQESLAENHDKSISFSIIELKKSGQLTNQ